MQPLRHLSALLGLVVTLQSAGATAQAPGTVIVDQAQGAVFDAILDGFPQIAPLDGQPDFGGNSLAVSLKAGVTEERGLAEYPIAALGEVVSTDIGHAALVFNIDDVLSTFGPGTDFSGRAAEEILVHVYAADGTVDLPDFSRTERTAHAVDTRPFGTVTDASLRASGALIFEVDITEDLQALIAEGASFIGILWRTADSPTGTSLDNLGDGSVGPPGVGGSSLPFLSIVLQPAASPTPTATPSPTATPTPVPATATQTLGLPTPTRTPSDGPCPGDCDGNRRVTIEELIAGVNVALGRTSPECAAMDRNDNGQVTIDELVRAVDAALGGC